MTRARPAAGRALHQVLTLVGSAGLAHAVSLAASPLLSRLYNPNEFGAFALFASVVALLSIGATGRYEMAVILPEGEDEARQVVVLALLVACPVLVLTGVVVFVGAEWFAAWAGDAGLANWVLLLPLAVGLAALANTLTAWANRTQAFRGLAFSRVGQSGVTALSSISFGYAGWASPGLLLGSILGQAAGAALLGMRHLRHVGRGIDPTMLKALLRRYRDFPRINLPHALLDALQASLVLYMVGSWYGATALGGYAFALRIARAPLAMLASSVAQVFQQRAARLASAGGDLRPLVRQATVRLAGVGLIFLFFANWAPEAFAWVFGEQWRGAGEQARILSPWMALNLVTGPLSQLPLILGRQGRAFGFGVFYQAAMLLPVAAGCALGWPLLHTLAAQTVAASAVLVAYGLWLHRLVRTTA